MKKLTVEDLRSENLIIFETLAGSHSYGTATPNSDIDIRGVFVLPENDILGVNYIPQVNDENNDVVYYEVRRFLELLRTNNPNMLELLFCPEDCVTYMHPVFSIILEQRDKFISKKCKKTFAGYMKQQSNKADGMEKMQNWEASRTTRKTPLDFCYATIGEKAVPLKKYLADNKMDQTFCGLAKVPHSTGIYALYYDLESAKAFSGLYSPEDRVKQKILLKEKGQMGLGYAGIEMEGSTKVRLSSIPKGEKVVCNITYNENDYSTHCKDYARYQTWLKERNTQRWTDVKNHGQQIDGKNMLHLVRISEMAIELAKGHGLNVRRNNADELLKIRRGEVVLKDILNTIDERVKEIDRLFDESNFPEEISIEFIHDILVEVRRQYYHGYDISDSFDHSYGKNRINPESLIKTNVLYNGA